MQIQFNDFFNKTAFTELTYELSILTPLAMYGADTDKDPMFRVPGFRGVMRYWWRALQHINSPRDLLRKEESWFGGASSDFGGKSPILFTVYPGQLNSQTHHLLPHRSVKKNSKLSISPGQTLKLTALLYKFNSKNLADYENMLELIFLLAGVGRRCRRGFGAIQWTTQHHFSSVNDYISRLMLVIANFTQGKFTERSNGMDIALPQQSPRHPVLKSVWIGAGQENYDTVLKLYGNASHLRTPNDRSLGGINPRYASPLLGTVRCIDGKYYPVISEMHSEATRKEPNFEGERNKFLKRMGVEL